MPDTLTDVLAVLRVRTAVYSWALVDSSWGVGFPASDGAYYHLVDGGHAWIELEPGGQRHRVGSGDIVLLAHGTAHRLTDQPGGPVMATFDPVTWTSHRDEPRVPGADQPRQRLVCGAVRVDSRADHPLLALLPPLLHVPADAGDAEELHLTLGLLAAEARAERPGSSGVMALLGDVLLVQLLRRWIAETPAVTGWLGALRDPQIGAVIDAIHDDPGATWTVATLADRASLSRSRFAQRFTELVGLAPLAYVTRWRMTVAAARLRVPGSGVGQVARAVGYTSEPAFSRAFSRHHGSPPSRYQQAASVRAQ